MKDKSPLENKKPFSERLGELVRDPKNTFAYIYKTLAAENYDSNPNFYRTTLYFCQSSGRFSYLFNQTIGDTFRGRLQGAKIGSHTMNDSDIVKDIAEIESIKEEKREELIQVLTELQNLGPEAVIADRKKYIFKHEISANELKLAEKYKELDSRLINLAFSCPATLLLYFYKNGDLKFLWGMNDDSKFRDIVQGYDLTFSQTVGEDW